MAAELARHGARCRIIDKASGPAAESRAIGIVPRTMEVFDIMGVVETIARAAHRLRAAGVYTGGTRIAHFDFGDLDTRYFVGVLPQSRTERLLTEHLASAGVAVERGVGFTDLSQDANGVVAHTRHADGREEVIQAEWLVGCDGAHSHVRKALNADFAGEQYEELFVLADVHLESRLSWDESYSFFHPSGQLLMFPMPDDVVRVVAILDERSRDRVSAEPTLSEMQAFVDERGSGGVRLRDAIWTSRFRVARRMVRQFRHGRVFLAGDAAHIHSPAGGQGMNTGIQDAHNLAWKLALVAAGRSPETLLDSYHAEREPVARAVVQMTDRFTRLATLQHPLAQGARNLLLAGIAGIERIEHRLVEDIAELTIDYRGSPIVAEDWGGLIPGSRRAGPRAGARAPDVLLPADGATPAMRLYERLRIPSHVLLLYTGPEPISETRNAIAAVVDDISARRGQQIATYEVPSGAADIERHYGTDAPWVYLIRPDGYIGFRGRPNLRQMSAYFQRVFR